MFDNARPDANLVGNVVNDDHRFNCETAEAAKRRRAPREIGQSNIRSATTRDESRAQEQLRLPEFHG